MAAFAAWRADYVKIDWCNTEGQDPASSVYQAPRRPIGRRAAHRFQPLFMGQGRAVEVGRLRGSSLADHGRHCGPGKADWSTAMKNTAENEKLYSAAGPGHWNDPDMLINGMSGLSETQNRTFFSLWCMMASPLMAGNDLRKMTTSTIQTLTNREAIGIDQDPLGIQGHIVRREGNAEIWAGKRLFDGSQAVLVFNSGSTPLEVRVTWSDIGSAESEGLYVRNLWTHQTIGPHRGGITCTVPPGDVALLRVSKSNAFPLPPVIVADSYRVSFHAPATGSQKLTKAITAKTTGSDELPPWKVRSDLPSWLTVAVTKHGKSQTLASTVSTAGLAIGQYHAVVRADNIEPVSGQPMSALYYDVDLEVGGGRDRN